VTLREKIFQIQKLARRAAKRGKATEGRREYEYLTIEDAVHFAKEQMRRRKLILTPNLQSIERHNEHVMDVVMNWTLEDVESEESKDFAIPGSGWDLYAKDTSKAVTASRKTAIVTIFNLEVGDDNENKLSPRDTQKEIAKQGLEAALGEEFPTLEHAEAAVMDRDEVRAAAQKSMFIAWPEAHNGHRFLLMGRKIAPTALHKVIEECGGKWSDREMGWFIPSGNVDVIRETIKKFNLPLIENNKTFERYAP
jgi:hypothetical protein